MLKTPGKDSFKIRASFSKVVNGGKGFLVWGVFGSFYSNGGGTPIFLTRLNLGAAGPLWPIYFPGWERSLGLSKIPRVVNILLGRLQIQEQMAEQMQMPWEGDNLSLRVWQL